MQQIPLRDAVLATKIVEKIFKHINMCLQNDRSKIKLNRFEKSVIKGMLSDKTLKGINGYIMNMYPTDIKSLMDDLEIEILLRKNQG